MRMNGLLKRSTLRAFAVVTFLVALWSPINVADAQQNSNGGTKKNFIWSVEKGKSTIYVLGSIHLLPKELMALDKAIEAGAYLDGTSHLLFPNDENQERP